MGRVSFFLIVIFGLLFSCSGNKREQVDNSDRNVIEEFFDKFDEFSDTPYLSKFNMLTMLDDENRNICNTFNIGGLCIVETDTLSDIFTNNIKDKVFEFKGLLENNKFKIKYRKLNDFRNKYCLCKIEYKQEGILGGCIIYATELYSFSINDIVKNPDNVKKNISREMMSVNFCIDAKDNIRLSTISELPKFFKKYPTARFATESELEKIYNENKVFYYNLAFYLVPLDSLKGFVNQNPDAIELKRNQISWK